MSWRGPAAVAALALALAGCSADTAENGPADKAQSTAETFLTECAKKNPEAVAGLLTAATRRTFIEAPDTLEACSEVAKLGGIGPPPEPSELERAFAEATVEEVAVNGGFGAVTVVTADDLRSTLELEEVHGRWYIANPLPSDPTPEAPPQEDAEKAVTDFLTACADEDALAAGYILVPKAEREDFVAAEDVLATCGDTVSWEQEPGAERLARVFEEAEVSEVAVEGRAATVTIETVDGSAGELLLEVQEGRWLLAPPVPPR